MTGALQTFSVERQVQTHCGSSLCRTASSKPAIENDGGESEGYLALILVNPVLATDQHDCQALRFQSCR